MATTIKEREKEQGLQLRRPLGSLFPDFVDEMERFWNFPFSRPRPLFSWLGRPTKWTPTVDIYEEKNHLVVEADLPGLKKEEVEVRLEEGSLVIQGERKLETEVKEENYYRAERAMGSFYRCMGLPFEVKAEDIEANFKDGVLTVRLPKPPEAKAKREKIPIH